MAARTKRHHYVPACYLKHWADEPDRNAKLSVFDRTTGHSRSDTPNGVAFERDFYTIDLREEPLAIEQLFAEFEGVFAPLFDALNASAHALSGEELEILITFIALQTSRTPRARNNLELNRSNFYKMKLRTIVDDPPKFEELSRKVNPQLTKEQIALARKELDSLLNVESLRVRFHQTPLIFDALTFLPRIEEQLRRRSWQLCVAENAEFVTCDEPVVLDFLDGRPRTLDNYPGYGDADSIVAVALGPTLLLLGSPTEVSDPVRQFSRDHVAEYNTMAVANAARFVFFRGHRFVFIDPTNATTIMDGPDEILRLRAHVGPESSES